MTPLTSYRVTVKMIQLHVNTLVHSNHFEIVSKYWETYTVSEARRSENTGEVGNQEEKEKATNFQNWYISSCTKQRAF